MSHSRPLKLYTLLLSIISLCARPPICDSAARHSNIILALTFGVYMYRDVFPLGAVSGTPQDDSDGILSWIRIALLGVAGLLIPLLTPRRYTPVDPLVSFAQLRDYFFLTSIQNPMKVTNPEQTASILSLAFYTFLDPTIFLAHRLVRLPYDLLPPLADYDSAQHLKSRSFQVSYPSSAGHVRNDLNY